MNFIRKIAQNQIDDFTHNAFVRYSMGEYEKEDFIIKKVGSKFKIWAGFEWVNVLLKFVASLCKEDIQLSGAIPTIKEIDSTLENFGVQFEIKRRYGKSGDRYEFSVTMPHDKALSMLNELSNNYLLLDLKCGNRAVKMKKKDTPKIGSPAPKFVTAVTLKEDFDRLKEEFLFDIDATDFTEVIIKHIYKITDIIVDEKLLEEDPARARQEAKRKGVIYRTIIIDGNEQKKEYEFEV